MSGPGRAAVGSALALLIFGSLGALSRFGYTADAPDEAQLRLAWRAVAPRVESCRRLTEAEQAALPAHMRREEVCEGRVASYRLDVRLDGRRVGRWTVEGAGARGDRPLYVYRTIPVRPGRHRVEVHFDRIGAGADPAPDGRAPSAGPPRVPDSLRLAETIQFEPRDVVLVTYAADRRRLERVAGRRR